MNRIIIIIAFVAGITGVKAQSNSIDAFLESVKVNNTTLKALSGKADADKTENKMGINLANPEIEFGKLWAGSGSGESNEIDFSVTQSFDFPTAYRNRSKMTDEQNKSVDIQYQVAMADVLHQARLLCVEYIFMQKMNKELKSRSEAARNLLGAYQKLFDRGEVSILDRNKAKLNQMTVEKALQLNEVELSTLRLELERLNGGVAIPSIEDYSPYASPIDFEAWFNTVKDNIPLLQQSQQEISVSRKQESLARSLNLPKFKAGYKGERVGGFTSQGFTVGMSIPLWEGRNTVKSKKIQTRALEFQHEDTQLQMKNQLRNQYGKAVQLAGLLDSYKKEVNPDTDYALLQKAFEKGQLSLINYLLELEAYYELTDEILNTEKEYQLAKSELERWEK